MTGGRLVGQPKAPTTDRVGWCGIVGQIMAQQSISTTASPRFGFKFDLRFFALLSVAFGLAVSGYLSYVKLTNVAMECVRNSTFDCGTVQNSAYGQIFGVPIAVFGFLMYVVVALLLVFENAHPFLQLNGRALTFVVVLFAWLFSMWLVYVQFFILEALCPWCLSHEANMCILFPIVTIRMVQGFREASTA